MFFFQFRMGLMLLPLESMNMLFVLGFVRREEWRDRMPYMRKERTKRRQIDGECWGIWEERLREFVKYVVLKLLLNLFSFCRCMPCQIT